MGQRLEGSAPAAWRDDGALPVRRFYCSTLGRVDRGAWRRAVSASYYGKVGRTWCSGLTAGGRHGDILKVGPERVPGPEFSFRIPHGLGGDARDPSPTRSSPSDRSRAARAMRGYPDEVGRAGARRDAAPHACRSATAPAAAVRSARFPDGRSHDGTPQESHVPAAVKAAIEGFKIAGRWRRALRAGRAESGRRADPPRCLLVVSYEGDSQPQVEEELRMTSDIVRETGGSDVGERPGGALGTGPQACGVVPAVGHLRVARVGRHDGGRHDLGQGRGGLRLGPQGALARRVRHVPLLARVC